MKTDALSPERLGDDERAIRELVATWMEASRRNDLATILDLMTDDILFLVPGRQPFGKSDFAAASAAMAKVEMTATANIQEVQVLGDWAYLRNYLTVSVTPPDGAAHHHAGHTLTILRKEADGRWRLARDANLVMALDAAASGSPD